ncbi:hypothetical protein FH972_021159 [Carpinus fangiana]|uniref:Neprosin domain-containing protein n=1 Tax=Carpinus fangiana TaxID=176857 RepID=A0A5N6KNL3_9ROSI|nr:hypothetical protein FH972_021159 [Carpinus fangiana]
MSFLANAFFLVGSVFITELLAVDKHEKEANTNTYVTIHIGQGAESEGGNVPHVALWDFNGVRVGQYHPRSKDKIPDEGMVELVIPNSQTPIESKQVQAPYIMLSMNDDNAICINYITITTNGAQWTWTGDIGYQCGMDYYPSTLEVGSGVHTPKCVWIDKNHSGDLHFQGLSMHMPDFSQSQGMTDEFNADPGMLCDNPARFKAWPEIWPDYGTPKFLPPLQYTPEGADADPSRIKPQRKRKRDSSRKLVARTPLSSSNPKPSHLVVSSHDSHSAHELCANERSFGPDFVSTAEGIFCDMSEKKAWPLCSSSIKSDCFDLEAQSLRHSGLHRRGELLPALKTYNTTSFWDA